MKELAQRNELLKGSMLMLCQVPGKPKINRGMMSEMENRLAKRRDKVDKESYVSEGPDPVIITPPEPICLPPSG